MNEEYKHMSVNDFKAFVFEMLEHCRRYHNEDENDEVFMTPELHEEIMKVLEVATKQYVGIADSLGISVEEVKKRSNLPDYVL